MDGVTIPHTISGVAPAALLGNYNVFPGTIENARSEDILNALDAAYADGMDVANMSLGGNAHGVQDLLTNAVDNLDKGGMVVAVSAGNEGPGFGTLGSPGSATNALTAGASSVPHQVAYSDRRRPRARRPRWPASSARSRPAPLGIIDVVEGTGPAEAPRTRRTSARHARPLPAGTGVAVIARGRATSR